MKKSTLLLLSVLVTFTTAAGQTVNGTVVRVLDGDTYDLLIDSSRTIRVRMDGIDAPETAMPYYRTATDYLRELTRGQNVTIDTTNRDRYGRVISYSHLSDGRELSAEMIKAGYAWHFKRYNSDSTLAVLELEARAARRGLWQDDEPYEPSEIRRLRRSGRSTRSLFSEDAVK